MKDNNPNCPNCGALVHSEVCPYCGAYTNIILTDNLDYPLDKCKAVLFTFWNTIVPLILLWSFSIALVAMLLKGDYYWFFISIITIIVLVSLIILITNISRYIKVKYSGKEIDAIVYGTLKSGYILLLTNQNNDLKYIIYPIHDTILLNKANSKIKLLKYKQLYYIKKDNNE